MSRPASPSARPALPGALAEIADHAGREAALEVAYYHGGQTWRVPRCIDSPGGQALVDLIGRDPARALVEGCGGHVLDVPLARRAVTAWLADQGLGAAAIAARLRITRSTARRYIRGRSSARTASGEADHD